MKIILTDKTFKLMSFIMNIKETVHPQAEKRAKTFGIVEGMTIVDYGCGPGRYTIPFAKIVGNQGKVFATDLSKMAGEEIKKKIKQHHLNNIQFSLANGYNSNIDNEIADMVFALDIFIMIDNPKKFLMELNRICKKDGVLIIDDGHQSRKITKKKIIDSGAWKIVEERNDYLKCKKI